MLKARPGRFFGLREACPGLPYTVCQFRLRHQPPDLFLAPGAGIDERLRLLVKLRYGQTLFLPLFRGQEGDTLHGGLRLFKRLFFLLCDCIDLGADPGVDIRAGDHLQNFGFLFVLAVEKTGELPLGQHGGAAELLEAEPDGPGDFRLNLSVPGIGDARLQVLQGPFLALDPAGGLVAGPGDGPFGLIRDAVGALEAEGDKALAGILPEQLDRVADLDLLPGIRHGALHPGIFQTRGAPVEGQADGVQEGAFPGTGLAGNQEDIAAGERCRAEIYRGILDGGNVVNDKLLDLHGSSFSQAFLSSSLTASSTSRKRAARSSSKTRPLSRA